MRSTIDSMSRQLSTFVAIACMTVLCAACGRDANQPAASEAGAFVPYAVQDSARITRYPDGLSLYIVEAGPGDYPQNGERVRMHYHGTLDDGTVFDDSYSRGEPLEFTVGSGKVIAGIESAARKLRFGTKAIAVVPPSLGYGDGTESKLPPKIPANARLTFHIDMVGSF